MASRSARRAPLSLTRRLEFLDVLKAFDNRKTRLPFSQSDEVSAVAVRDVVSVKDFLKQRAVNVSVGGHYTLANWLDPQGKPRTFACRTKRVSPFRMMVNVPVLGKVGDSINSYFGDFGKLDGVISDTFTGGFLLELEMPRSVRAKFARKLTWLEKKHKNPAGIRDVRKNARIIPATPHSTLILADGTTQGCFVIDMSTSGVAVSADIQPPIGMPLAVGACVGRVVRLLPEGFAVKFVEPQNCQALDRLLIRPQPKGLPAPSECRG